VNTDLDKITDLGSHW